MFHVHLPDAKNFEVATRYLKNLCTLAYLFVSATRPDFTWLILHIGNFYEGWNFNSGNYLFTTDTE